MKNNNTALTEQVAILLQQYILDNDLKPGEKIPPENTLGLMMSVGRGTIREAVKILASRNILEVKHGSGTYIAENLGILDDPFGLTFIKDRIKLTRDLLEIRSIIEPPIAALAAKNATNQDIAELRELCLKVETLLLQGKNYIHEDVLFHKKIAELSKNLVIPNFVPIISHAIQLFTQRTNRQLLNETLETHRAIVAAIEARDTSGAHEAMYLHLMYNRNLLQKIEKQELETENS